MANTNGSRPANLPAGVSLLHQYRCPKEPCACTPKFLAGVYSKRDAKKIRKSFATLAEAKRWLNEQRKARDDGGLKAPTRISLEAAAERFLADAKSGAIRNRSGDRYKPSALRSYEASLRRHILPVIGKTRLSEVSRQQLQRLVGKWQEQGQSASSIGNHVNALRAIYGNTDSLTDGNVPTNPTQGLRLPARRGRRERIASVDEAGRLLAGLPESDRALWGTAFYAGLRRGEIRGLRWADVDLAGGAIHVRTGWDDREGEIDPKSQAGTRKVPIIGRLRDLLVAHKMLTGRSEGLVFGRTETRPFNPTTVAGRAKRTWKAAGLEGIGLHEARHTFASYLIASGANIKVISVLMGHASVAFTLDRYAKLLPDSNAEIVAALDAFMERSDTLGRTAALN
jgi:integrase